MKKPEELQAEYMELLESLLTYLGLCVPACITSHYDMRMGYEAEEAAA